MRPRLTSRALFALLTPSRLMNCTLKIRDAHDGGYVMCENLMEAHKRRTRMALTDATGGATDARPSGFGHPFTNTTASI